MACYVVPTLIFAVFPLARDFLGSLQTTCWVSFRVKGQYQTPSHSPVYSGEQRRQSSQRWVWLEGYRPRLLPTHLAIFFADRGTVAVSKSHCDKIAQPDGLTLLAIRSDERRKSRKCAHLSNAGEFNHGYLICQTSAILYADRGDRRKSQSRHRAHLSIFADRGNRRIKSPSVSLALH